jgi:hypothetical protein
VLSVRCRTGTATIQAFDLHKLFRANRSRAGNEPAENSKRAERPGLDSRDVRFRGGEEGKYLGRILIGCRRGNLPRCSEARWTDS